jgi:hypothetical protein
MRAWIYLPAQPACRPNHCLPAALGVEVIRLRLELSGPQPDDDPAADVAYGEPLD